MAEPLDLAAIERRRATFHTVPDDVAARRLGAQLIRDDIPALLAALAARTAERAALQVENARLRTIETAVQAWRHASAPRAPGCDCNACRLQAALAAGAADADR